MRGGGARSATFPWRILLPVVVLAIAGTLVEDVAKTG
jgi:hypothetical protein